jgi:hypothetical protein
MAPRSKDFGLEAVLSAFSFFSTDAAADGVKGFFVGALPVCPAAVIPIRRMHGKTRFQSIGTLRLNFIKLESLCPFAKAVQQKLLASAGPHPWQARPTINCCLYNLVAALLKS